MSQKPAGVSESLESALERVVVTVVIPAYRVEKEIRGVLTTLPGFVRHIVVVDDASPDRTSDVVGEVGARDGRVVLVRHERNRPTAS